MFLDKDESAVISDDITVKGTEITEIPSTFEELKELNWAQITRYMETNPKTKAYRALRNEIAREVDKVMISRHSHSYRGIYHIAESKKDTFISAWTEALVGQFKEDMTAMQRCLSSKSIWPELKDPMRKYYKDQVDSMIKSMTSGQVQVPNTAVFNFDTNEGNFVVKTRVTGFESMEQIAQHILDYQKTWAEAAKHVACRDSSEVLAAPVVTDKGLTPQ
ncbi:hypothetical protein I203_105712 [Kwoniella mangroviensis CBS 8507]|uniref:uncharacterized protein n=1 Tax=Kwoniella mangroviensis CBS 8507 TaxID=1296122 RepID=UPI00080D7E32|nr:uncharacterized protein I203_01524 [Kwoniella mangroviensis CBS 8507]OCF69660.1 hypothetical protein I203_01524 [Kwoniella mangroviensis CBS 8507]